MAKKKQTKIDELTLYYTMDSFIVGEIDESILKVEEQQSSLLQWIKKFEKDKFKALFHLGFSTHQKWFSPSVEYLYQIAELLIKKLSKHVGIEFERGTVHDELSEDEVRVFKEEAPFVIGMEYVDINWIHRLWDSLLEVFNKEIVCYEGTVAMYFTEHNSNIHIAGRVFFHLVENKDVDKPFAFMATYSNKPVKSKRTIHTPFKNALVEYKNDDKKLLSLISTVIKAAERSDFIFQLLESGELFSPISLTAMEAYTFLSEIAIYEESGIMCRVPDWWRKKSNAVKLSVTVGEKELAKVGLNAMLDFSPTLSVGGEELTEQELRAFLSMAEGLVQYKGKWVEINKSKLEAVLQAFDQVMDYKESDALTLGEAMRMALNVENVLDLSSDEVDVSISNGQWLRGMKETLTNPVILEPIDPMATFYAKLREYQLDGYNWLHKMSQFGFGACLADDMGLGKTVQIIAFLEYQRVMNGGKVLLILPASLIGNWQKELEKFAPELTYQILHPSVIKSQEQLSIDESVFLCMTTYGMAMRMEALKNREWDILILDEAQAIKNPGTKQTKNIKEIKAKMRIAMTGTPIENRLSDLWSLFDFLNPGLLGTSKEFTKFTKELKENVAGYGKLRKMINPFLLRRLKTDKKIIADLPDKIEIIEYAALSKKQVGLYEQLVEQISQRITEVEGIERKGLVLSSIMKFKQICNHPDQYLGREDYKPTNSGKFQQLGEICKTIYEKRERVLIFTQFREIAEPLSDFLKTIFFKEGFVLHGGTSVKKRTQMVEEFNSEHYIPYMVLSLKAGGVGLNLTKANHVIHFDRWWNPAVENQATDRAFRIGQMKKVMVYKFVTKGTIEEKIDAMITEKQNLAKDILSSGGEKWITEFSDDELLTLFSLEGSAE